MRILSRHLGLTAAGLAATAATALAGVPGSEAGILATAGAATAPAAQSAPAALPPTQGAGATYAPSNGNAAVSRVRDHLRIWGNPQLGTVASHYQSWQHPQIDRAPANPTWYAAGPLRGGKFTLRFVADRACVTLTPVDHGAKVMTNVTEGPCAPGDVVLHTDPAAAAAAAFSVLTSRSEEEFTGVYLWQVLNAKALARTAGDLPGTGDSVTDLADLNGDGLDDNGYVEFRAGARRACVVLPPHAPSGRVHGLDTYTVTRPCSALPARVTSSYTSVRYRAMVKAETRRVGAAVQQRAAQLGVPVRGLTDTDLRPVAKTLPAAAWLDWHPRGTLTEPDVPVAAVWFPYWAGLAELHADGSVTYTPWGGYPGFPD